MPRILPALLLIAVFISFFRPFPAQAQLSLGDNSPASKAGKMKQAEEFFEKCVTDPIVSIDPQTDDAFCACASMNLYAWLDKPENREGTDLLEAYKKKELTRDVLLSDVYASCLYIPALELSRDDCRKRNRGRFFMGDDLFFEATCYCVAEGISDYYRKYAKPYIEMLFAKEKNFLDPFDVIERDNEFYKLRENLETRCNQEFTDKKRALNGE